METETAETTDWVFLSSHSDMWGYKLVLPSYKLLGIIKIKDDVPPPCTNIVRRDIKSTSVYGNWSTIFCEKIFNLFLILNWQWIVFRIYQYVLHKAVAEVSKIVNYRRGSLL